MGAGYDQLESVGSGLVQFGTAFDQLRPVWTDKDLLGPVRTGLREV